MSIRNEAHGKTGPFIIFKGNREMPEQDSANIPLKNSHLIEAGAGTGKTYTICTLFLRLILAGHDVERILVVTFTEAATAELKDRIRSLIRTALCALSRAPDSAFGDEASGDAWLGNMLRASPADIALWHRRLQRAISSFDKAGIFTIHGFCRRMLQENAFESGIVFDPELVSDPLPLYREVVTDFWTREMYKAPEWVVRLLEQEKMTPDSLVSLVAGIVSQPKRRLIPEPAHEIACRPDLQEMYTHARDLWRTCRREIEVLIKTHPGVNRRSYSKRNVARWLARAARFFRTPHWPWDKDQGDIQVFTQTRFDRKVKKDRLPPRHAFFKACDDLLKFRKGWVLQFLHRLIGYAREQLALRKQARGILFFDDLIHHLDNALEGPGGETLARKIQRRYSAVLVDEFQDTDHAQYRILHRISHGSGTPFFMVGDPKQSIYAFRGADVFAYLKAAAEVGDRVHALAVNWRSDPALIRGVNTLFTGKETPFINANIRFSPTRSRPGGTDAFRIGGRRPPAFRFIFFSRDQGPTLFRGCIAKEWFSQKVPAMVAGDIAELLAGEAAIQGREVPGLSPGDIAVLVRTNQQATEMQTALRSFGIPGVVTSGQSVFESAEALELWQVLQAVAEPADDTLVRTALSTTLFGVSGNALWRLQTDDHAWADWISRFRNWHAMWRFGGFMTMVQAMFNLRPAAGKPTLMARLLERNDGQRRVTNFQHLCELLHAATESLHLGVSGLQRWFMRQCTEGGRTDAHELRLESDAHAVQLVTIHKSKGLEYPVVYAPYLWDGRLLSGENLPVAFHDPVQDNAAVFDIGSGDMAANRGLARREAMAENMRLLYVALTRARHHCVVIWAGVNQLETSPLGYLLHHPGPGNTSGEAEKQIRELTDEQLLADLERLAGEAAGAIGVETFREKPPSPFEPDTPLNRRLACRVSSRRLKRRWRSSSFSGLVAETPEAIAHEAPLKTPDLGPDLGPDLSIDRDHDDMTPLRAFSDDPATMLQTPVNDRVLLAEFDRGPRAGHCFHAIYEKLDFEYAAQSELEAVVGTQLTGFGFDADRWEQPVCDAISQSLRCDLDPDLPGLRLAKIPTGRRLNELPFVFPVSDTDAPRSRLTARRLASLFSGSATRAVSPNYHQRLAGLSFAPLAGFMRGVIDLIFEYQGRWYLVDYKSNFLGAFYRNYQTTDLTQAMAEHDYYLQYHIYTLAVHRYLSYRIKNYDFDTHFGKVYYLFIRGMSPAFQNGGVFIDRPSREMVESLDAMFSGIASRVSPTT